MEVGYGQSRWSRFSAVLIGLERFLALIGGICILLIVALGLGEVLLRKLLNAPIFGQVDFVEQLMVPVALLGVAYCQAHGGNVRMSLFLDKTSGRMRWAGELLSYFIGLIFIAFIVYASIIQTYKLWHLGGTAPTAGFALWIPSMVVPVALLILALRLLIQIVLASAMIADPQRPVPEGLPRSFDYTAEEI